MVEAKPWYNLSICLAGWRKSKKYLSHERKCNDQDTNAAPPNCESRALLLCPSVRLNLISLIKKCEVYLCSHKFTSLNPVLGYVRQCRFVVQMSEVQISVCRAAVLTESSHGFFSLSRQALQWCLRLGHDWLILHPFQFIIHYLPYGLTLYHLSYWHHH